MVNGEGIFETPDCDDLLRISFAYILFAQMYLMMLYYAVRISDCEKGHKGKELKHDRKPFKEKVGSKLSNYYFRRVYQMTRHSSNKLHDLLEP